MTSQRARDHLEMMKKHVAALNEPGALDRHFRKMCDRLNDAMEDAEQMLNRPASVHTNDIGIAIRDALELMTNDGKAPIETFDWSCDMDCANTGAVLIEGVDASNASNLHIVMADGSSFRIRIIKEG